MPPSEMTATSVVPPPMSTTMEPLASETEAGADGRGHGLFDQVDVGGAGAQRRLADGAPLDLGRAARRTRR